MSLSWKIEYALSDLSWTVEDALQDLFNIRYSKFMSARPMSLVQRNQSSRKPGDVNRYKTPKDPGIGGTTFFLELPDEFWREGDTLYCHNERVVVLAKCVQIGSRFTYPVKLDTVDPNAYLPEEYLTDTWTFRIHHEYQNEKTVGHWPLLN